MTGPEKLAALVVELGDVHAEAADERLGSLAGRISDVLEALGEIFEEIDRRFDMLELAVRGVLYEPAPSAPEQPVAETTVFGIPVRVRPGFSADDVRETIGRLPAGLDGPQVVDELVTLNVVERVRRG